MTGAGKTSETARNFLLADTVRPDRSDIRDVTGNVKNKNAQPVAYPEILNTQVLFSLQFWQTARTISQREQSGFFSRSQ